jgi:type II secretory pathway pseudopilin PulG
MLATIPTDNSTRTSTTEVSRRHVIGRKARGIIEKPLSILSVMSLRGQDWDGDRGYAMAALLVALSVMAIALTVALPVWKTAAKREKETELIFRGQQYVRAIGLFQRKYANANPPNLDILLNERFLRKKYKDPMTKDGEFQVLYASNQAAVAGQVPQQGQQGTSKPTATPPSSTSGVPATGIDAGGTPSAGAQGGIIGVVSKSKDSSLRLYNGRSKYNEWVFVYQAATNRVTAPGGAQRPGLPPGRSGPGNLPGGPGIRPGGMRPGSTPGSPGQGRTPGALQLPQRPGGIFTPQAQRPPGP